MATISLTRDIKLTNEDALKILNHKPSKKLQAVLKSIESCLLYTSDAADDMQ